MRRSRADERMKRGTGIVIALIVLALAGVLGVGGYVIYVLNSAQANPAAQSAGPGALPAGR
jgi:flagellar basal body-associated protein FliL